MLGPVYKAGQAAKTRHMLHNATLEAITTGGAEITTEGLFKSHHVHVSTVYRINVHLNNRDF